MSVELVPLGESIRRARKTRQLTLRALADRSGLSLRFLSDLERGRGNISIARLVAVARALGTPLSELVSVLDVPPDGPPPPRLALIGLRGAGKSTIGKRAADALGLPFLELDARIEVAAGLPLQQIFEISGESYYRRLQRKALQRLLEETRDTGAVIATGGGIVMDEECWAALRREARTIWLRARPEDHYVRVEQQGDLRPMQNRPAAMAELRALLDARAALYAQADVVVDTSQLGLEGATARVIEAGRSPAA